MKKTIVFNQQEQTILVTYSLFGVVIYTLKVDTVAIVNGFTAPV